MSSSILAGRTVSAFPLSIGTSLAFESLSQSGGRSYDPERKIPQRVNLNDYQQFWINLGTLFRNIYSAIPSSDAERLRAEDCAQTLLSELDTIEDIVRSETNGQLKVKPYISNYKSIIGLNSAAQPRLPNTPKKLAFFKLHDKAIQLAMNIRHGRNEDISVFNKLIVPENSTKSLIFTHLPYDLLCWPKFDKLELIESHTGILKQRNLWYTKFYQSEDLVCIPFIECMLKFYGDNHTFKAFPINARKTVLELAIEKRWHWATTEAKVKQDVSSLKDHLLAETIKHL